MDTRRCPRCQASFASRQHESFTAPSGFARYDVTSFECNEAYGQLIAYEYSQGCFSMHSPQAYAVQHPPPT